MRLFVDIPQLTRVVQDKVTGVDLEVIEDEPLTEWMAQHYRDHGCRLDFVTGQHFVALACVFSRLLC